LTTGFGSKEERREEVEMERSTGNMRRGAFVPGVAMVLFSASARQLKPLRAAQSHKQ